MRNQKDANDILLREYLDGALEGTYEAMMKRNDELFAPHEKKKNDAIKTLMRKTNPQNETLEDEKNETPLRGIPNVKIIAPEDDELCINELVIQLQYDEKIQKKHQFATLYIMDNNDQRVAKERLKFDRELKYSVRHLEPGLYYWRLGIGFDTWMGRVFLCNALQRTLIYNSLDLQ